MRDFLTSKRSVLAAALLACFLVTIGASPAHAADNAWPMTAGNPQRTSWVPENIPLNLKTKWVKPIEPYVSARTQVIAAENKLFLSTTRGLYAFDAESGSQSWVFPTELPLGDAPTYANGVLYVGGFDKNVYAINAANGQQVWKFTGNAGFSTNPLVVNNVVYIGSRGGVMYGLNAANGQQVFAHTTGSQILQAAAYNNNKIYFATLEGFAYALNAADGGLVWKSSRLPGMGMHGWWPVIYQNAVIFTRTRFESGLRNVENTWLFSNTTAGNLPGNLLPNNQWITNQPTIDVKTNPYGNSILDYIEQNYTRRTAFFLNEATGAELTFNLDGDDKVDGIPMLWTGGSGQLHPPIVSGYDNKLYFRTVNYGSGAIPGALASGWEYQTSKISYPFSSAPGASPDWPSDEQTGLSAAGSKLYYSLCCDRNAGAADLAISNSTFPEYNASRQQRYISGSANPPAASLPAGYHAEATKFYWKPDGPAVYASHSDNVGPSIYNGKLYIVRSNAIIAFSADGAGSGAPVLGKAATQSAPSQPATISLADLKSRLEQEVGKIIAAGHLKPSFVRLGLVNNFADSALDDHLFDYWHNPADTQYFLLRAYPYLNSTLQAQLKTYLQSEFASYSPVSLTHIGYTDGTARDPYIYPPLDNNVFNEAYIPKQTSSNPFTGWTYPPHNIYAIWKYAASGVSNTPSSTLFGQISGKLAPTITATKSNLTDSYLASFPHVHNAYIAGYYGYVELAKLAGQPASAYQPYVNELNRLMSLRAANFTIFPTPASGDEQSNNYFYTNLPAWNFMYMVPELATYLKTNASANLLNVLNSYESKAPFWPIALSVETQGENGFVPYQVTHGLFQANAKIRGLDQATLSKYLDNPVVPTGDLFFIDNLVSTIEASGTLPSIPPSPTPSNPPPVCNPSNGDLDASGKVTTLDLSALLGHYGKTNPTTGDLNCDGAVNNADISKLLGNLK